MDVVGMCKRTAGRGFTLIEMMVVVAAIAILAAIALPAYSDYVKRGKLPEAFNQMSGLSMALEQYYQDNRTYVGACAAGSVVPVPANTANFSYACTVTATTYTITAVGLASGPMNGFTFTLKQDGTRATTGVPTGWTSNSTCWVNSKGGTCV